MVVTNVILPIFLVVLLGFILRKFGRLDEKAISRTQLYILSPALIFTTMAGSENVVSLGIKVFLYILILVTIILALMQGIGFLLKSGKAERNAMSLAAVFTNSGFYGIPVCMLAFGEQGLVFGTMYMVWSSMIQSTLGVYIASAGSRKPLEALATVFKVPLIHAIILARLLSHLDLLPPEPFMKMIDLLGRSAIPVGLLLLGMQLQRTVSRKDSGKKQAQAEASEVEPDHLKRRDLYGGVAAGLIRILGGFALALLLIRLFDFDPILRKVVILQSSMPTAVNVVVYATEFKCRPKLVAVGILTATLGSVVTLSLILNWLG